MSEREQILDLPLGKGLQEGTDPKLLPYGAALARLENFEVRRGGGFTKRQGLGATLAKTLADGTGSIGTVYRLDGRGDELLAIGLNGTDKQPHINSYSDGLDQWANVDSVGPCSVRRTPFARPTAFPQQPVLVPFGVGARRFELVAYRSTDGNGVLVEVRDAVTGAVVKQPSALPSAYAGIGLQADIRGVSINGDAWIIYNTDGGSAELRARKWSGVDLATTNVQVSSSPSWWHDACVYNLADLVVAWSDGADLYAVRLTNATGALGTVGNKLYGGDLKRVAVGSNGSKITCAVVVDAAPDELHVTQFAGDLSVVDWSTIVATPVVGLGQIGVCHYETNSSTFVLFEQESAALQGSLNGLILNGSGVAVGGSPRALMRACLASAPICIGYRIYALAALPQDGLTTLSSGYGGNALTYTGGLDEFALNQGGAGPPTTTTAMASVAAGHVGLFCWDDPNDDFWPVLVAKAVTTVGAWPLGQVRLWPRSSASSETAYACAALVLGGASLAVDRLVFDFEPRQPALHHQDEAPPLRALGGGLVATYDGAQVVESSFLQAPAWGEVIAATTGTPGLASAPSPGTAYLYLARYVAYDNAGQKHVGPWSQALLVTLTDVGSQKYNLTLQFANTGATRRGRAAFGADRKAKIELYRSTGNGAGASGDVVYYKLGSVDEMPEMDSTTLLATFLDDQSDETLLAQGEGQYVQPGDVLAPVSPPPSAHLCSHLGRLWLASGEDGQEVWASRLLVAGEAPVFPPELVARIPDSAGPITALIPSTDKLAICTASRLYYLTGEGPYDNGSGEFWRGPFLLNAFHGCVDARSLVTTPVGTYFLSRSGFLLLDPGLGVQPVGDAVRDTVEAYSRPLAAMHDAKRSRALWLMANADDETVIVVFDYLHQLWSRADTAIEDGLDAATIWGDALVVSAPVAGLRTEGDAAAADDRGLDQGDGVAEWVAGVLETPWVCPSGPGAYQRIRAVLLVGERLSGCKFTVRVYVNFDNATAVQTHEASIESAVSPSGSTVVRYLLPTTVQACEAIKVRITDAAPDEPDPPTGAEPRAGLGLQRIAFEFVPERGLPRLAATNRGGT